MRFLFWVVLLSVGLWLRVTAVLNSPFTLSGDEISFDVYGWSIAQGKGMARADGTLTSIRPPLYPFFLGAVYSFFGHEPLAAKFIQCFIGVATILLVYKIARCLIPPGLSRLTAILQTLYLPNIMAPTRLYAETLYLFFLVLCFWGICLFWKKPNSLLSVGSGFALGLAALTRAAGLPLALMLSFLLGWRTHALGKNKSLSLGLALFFVTGFFLPILPWTLRNWQVHHSFVLLTTEPGHTLYYAYFPKDGKIFGIVQETDLSRQASQIKDEVQRSRFLTQGVIRSILADPGWFIAHQLPLKIAFFWSPFHWELFGNGNYDGSYIFLFPFFIWGLWGLSRLWKDQLPLWILMFYPCLLTFLFYGSDRLRYPTTPAFLIFAAWGLSRFFEKWKTNPAALGFLSTFAAINLLLTLHSEWIKEWARAGLKTLGLW